MPESASNCTTEHEFPTVTLVTSSMGSNGFSVPNACFSAIPDNRCVRAIAEATATKTNTPLSVRPARCFDPVTSDSTHRQTGVKSLPLSSVARAKTLPPPRQLALHARVSKDMRTRPSHESQSYVRRVTDDNDTRGNRFWCKTTQ